MKKNTASQVVVAQLVSKTDGSAVTSGTTTVYVLGDGGTQATGSVGSGAATHEGNGVWSYAPAQAESNYDHVAFTFVNTTAVNATVQIYTSFPQTGDNYARLGAPAGASVSADVAAVKAVLPAALVSGRIDASVGAMASGVLTATAIAADAITDAKVASDVTIASVTGSVGSVTARVTANTDQLAGQTVTAAAGVTFPTSVASPTNITAGTITTVTNLTNAPSAGDFTATMKTSIGTAVAASAVASVTGDVGGNVTGSIGSLATQAKADVNAEADAALADVGVTTTITGRIDAAISTRLAGASYTAPLDAAGTRSAVGLATANLDTQIATLATATNLATVDTVVDAIKVVTDRLDDTLEDDGGTYRFTTNALEQAPSGGTPPTTAQIADKILGRSLAGGADGGRTVQDALRTLRNKSEIAAGTLTVYEEDDTTPAWTAAATTAPGDPLTSIDPT